METTEKVVQEVIECSLLVHTTLGPGFLESIYVRALASELKQRSISVEREKLIKIWYGTQIVGKHRLDLIVDGIVIVELKANSGIASVHVAQLRSYLQATAYPFGLILNFGKAELEWELLRTAKPQAD